MAARPIWSGSITFGLVNIPVKLYNAVREQGIHFHMLHDQDHARLQRKMVCSADGKEVHAEHIVKGYEVAPDQYVVVSQEELDSLAPERTQTIEIRDFVDLDEIDPVYFDRPYYVAPTQQSSKSYKLLVDAMMRKKKVGIAKFVMRNKEYLAALRPVEGSLCLETMHFGSEVSDIDDVPGLPVHAKVDDRELKVAEQLIDSLASEFDADAYKDEYRDRVLELIDKKASGEKVHVRPAPEMKTGRVVDLMAALEASLEKARAQQGRQLVGAAAGKGGKRQSTRRRKSA